MERHQRHRPALAANGVYIANESRVFQPIDHRRFGLIELELRGGANQLVEVGRRGVARLAVLTIKGPQSAVTDDRLQRFDRRKLKGRGKLSQQLTELANLL